MVAASLDQGGWSPQVFQLGGVSIAAKRWGPKTGLPTLALHGWLDNCASFDVIAPLLASHCDLVCIDSAGHGLSGHRSHLGAYNIWQDVIELFAIADRLGWDEFNLIGHSRGAMVAFLAAGTFPLRIKNLVMIDGILPVTARADEAPKILADAIAYLKADSSRVKQYYSSLNAAVTARSRGLFPLSENDALLLAQRGVKETERGFAWCYDHKLMVGSEVRFSLEQINAFRDALPARKLLIKADQGILVSNELILQWLATVTELTQLTVAGEHHAHMLEQGANIAPRILEFFLRQ